MCFFFILGVIPRERRVGSEMRFCSYEGRETRHVLIERRMWFTLFFIPLFPVSGKQVTARCESCGLTSGEQTLYRARGTKVCPDCGGEVTEEARFCQHCEHRLG